MSQSVVVTEADIMQGRAGDCLSCPVALALNRCLGGHWSVSVDGLRRLPTAGKSDLLIPTPDEVVDFIDWFDDDDAPAPLPFSFELDIQER